MIKKALFLLLIAIGFTFFSTLNTTAQTKQIFFAPPTSEQVDATNYKLSGTIDITKHKDTDAVPLSSIRASANINTRDSSDTLWVLKPISYGSGIDVDGRYVFLTENIPFDQNTTYDIWLVFESDKGTRTQKKVIFSTEDGITPEAGKSAEGDVTKNSYRLLAPLPGMTILLEPELCKQKQQTNPQEICDINGFLNFVLTLAIGLAAVVLVVRIIISGYGYMASDIPFVKARAKGQFFDALIGLLTAMSSYLILNTISPRLVRNDITIEKVAFSIDDLGTDAVPVPGSIGSGKGDVGYDFNKILFPAGVQCPGKTGGTGDIRTVALSFKNHVTYKQVPRGIAGPSGTVYLDCSSYVNTVIKCAGSKPNTAAWTQSMYSSGEKISSIQNRGGVAYVNNKALKAGDLVGHRDTATGKGHVWIYIGNGEIIDSQVSHYRVGQSVISTKQLAEKIYGLELNFVVRL